MLDENVKTDVKIPLESMPDCPTLFKAYRTYCNNPALTRKPGGWEYNGKFYPDYITVGGASFCIFRTALKFCKGYGVDIGAGLWPLPGSIPVDLQNGVGVQNKITDFEDDSLDYIFSSHCLEHITDWQEALKVWIGKLKQDGILFFYLPHPDCEVWNPGAPFVGNGHVWIPTPEIIKKAFADNNIEVLEYDDGPDAMYSFYVCGRKK